VTARGPDTAPVVAIDGPSGAGKGTVSRLLATRLGWHLLDSGALYRLVALAGQQARLGEQDVEGHALLASHMKVRFGADGQGGEQIWLLDQDVTRQLRSELTGAGASRVAQWIPVREALLDRQRQFARPPGLVADGRDMGSVVFAGAPLKIFLTASAKERAQRRYNQLKDKGSAVNLAGLSRDIEQRDRQDATRAASPLVAAPDAVVLDSTQLSASEVAQAIVELGAARGLWVGDAQR
jgi:cytidylate kinase